MEESPCETLQVQWDPFWASRQRGETIGGLARLGEVICLIDHTTPPRFFALATERREAGKWDSGQSDWVVLGIRWGSVEIHVHLHDPLALFVIIKGKTDPEPKTWKRLMLACMRRYPYASAHWILIDFNVTNYDRRLARLALISLRFKSIQSIPAASSPTVPVPATAKVKPHGPLIPTPSLKSTKYERNTEYGAQGAEYMPRQIQI